MYMYNMYVHRMYMCNMYMYNMYDYVWLYMMMYDYVWLCMCIMGYMSYKTLGLMVWLIALQTNGSGSNPRAWTDDSSADSASGWASHVARWLAHSTSIGKITIVVTIRMITYNNKYDNISKYEYAFLQWWYRTTMNNYHLVI